MTLWNCALPRPEAPTARVLAVIERVWAQVLSNPEMAGPIISQAMREERALGSKERPVAADCLLGMIRHEHALRRINPDLLRAWLLLSTDGCPSLSDPDDPVEAFCVATSVPRWLGEQWWRKLGSENAAPFARILAGRAPVWLRVLRDPVHLDVAHTRVGSAVRLEERGNINVLPAYRVGAVEVQDLGSQFIADAAFPGAGGTVLDLCAGAGGKSLALAARGARVTAWDIRPGALHELARRARHCGLDISIEPPHGNYDVILVDAPCSGTGVLRRHPENRWKLRLHVEEQRELLARCVGRTERIVYATCSLAEEENERLTGVEGTTVWPEADGSEGYYWASLPGTVAIRPPADS